MAEVDDGDSAGNTAAQSLAAASPDKVSNYLQKVVPVILEDYDGLEKLQLERALADKMGADALKKFISDPQSRALLVSRHLSITEEDESDSAPSSMSSVFFSITADVRYTR